MSAAFIRKYIDMSAETAAKLKRYARDNSMTEKAAHELAINRLCKVKPTKENTRGKIENPL